MSGTQKGILAVLVLGNLVLYSLGYFALQSPAAQQNASTPTVEAVSLPPTVIARPQVVASPTRTLRATSTFTPTPIPKPSLTASPTLAPQPPTATPVRKPTVRRVSAPATRTPPPPPVTQSGADPFSPLLPGDAWQTLSPKTSVWYKVGNGGDHMDVLLQAQPIGGMKMEVFAPGNLGDPIGQGTPQRGLDGLAWSGGHWESNGAWFARITNDTFSAVQYRVISNTFVIGTCETISYWEYIGQTLVYWTRCK